jgi:Bacterial PH domain
VGQPQTFRSPTAVVVWIGWLLFAVGNWIDLAVQGRDHLSVVAAAILLLATGVGYVTAQRPRVIADDAGVTVRNPLRDHRIGWAGVAQVDLADQLRVHCAWGTPPDQQSKVISAWAVHYSRRRQMAAEVRSRRAARTAGRRSSLGVMSSGRGLAYDAQVPGPGAATAEVEAETIVRVLGERATAAKAEAVWAASGTTAVAAASRTGPLTSTWSGRAIAALVIPALILLVVCLL